MSKGRYSATKINHVDLDRLAQRFCQDTLVLCTDVAKVDMYTAFADAHGQVEHLVEWTNPDQLEALDRLVSAIGAEQVVVVLESTGTYGEPLRALAFERGWQVRLVSAKRVSDIREVYDGVPSLHDAKAATLIAKLHADGLSQPWGPKGDDERRLRAHVKTMARRQTHMQRLLGMLEAELARWWPEVDALLDKDSATLLALLGEFGGPGPVAAEAERARQLMRRVGGPMLSDDKIEAVLASAKTTAGQRMLDEELQMLSELAGDIDAVRKKARQARHEVAQAGQRHDDVEHISRTVGKPTAAILRDQLGDFRDYDSPGALVKACGMILKEKSSGSHQGELKISKRGSATARHYLWWAALRMIRDDAVFMAWHRRKVERDGGLKTKSIVALMRKLLKGLWHAARGKPFDSTKLFDTRRLGLT